MNSKIFERTVCKGIRWKDVSALFREVGWGERAPSDIQRTFKKSTFVIFLFDQSGLVGFGRTVDDGCYYAWVVDIIVRPSHPQRQRLERRIMKSLQNRLNQYAFVVLTALPEAQGFYKQLGWRCQKTAMILPRSVSQAKRHCE